MSLPKTTISTRPTCTCVHLSNYWHVLMHVGLPWTYMNLVLPEGARKLGGRRGCSRRGTFVHALLCSTALLTFVSKYLDFFLRMTQHVIYLQVYVIINGSVCGWGGGGGRGAIAARGVAFHMPWGRGGKLAPPTPKAMLDPGLHGLYLDLS